MLTVSLEQLRFHSHIGMYPEEKILGNDILIDIHIRIEENNDIESLSDTVDYSKVYELIKAEMSKPYELLESVAQNCLSAIQAAWHHLSEAEIIIQKLHPPLPGEVGCSKITLSKKFR